MFYCTRYFKWHEYDNAKGRQRHWWRRFRWTFWRRYVPIALNKDGMLLPTANGSAHSENKVYPPGSNPVLLLWIVPIPSTRSKRWRAVLYARPSLPAPPCTPLCGETPEPYRFPQMLQVFQGRHDGRPVIVRNHAASKKTLHCRQTAMQWRVASKLAYEACTADHEWEGW